jgi:ribosome-associated heat shock protein Hsp15
VPDTRVDSWLWAVRLVKTRSAATALCRAGHVRVNGERAKPAQRLKAGDEVRFAVEGGPPRVVVVRDPGLVKRVGAPIAQAAYEDDSPPPPPPEERLVLGVRDRGAGRPTKRDRRDIDRLRGR